MTLEIIGPGFGRTGTASLREALLLLGFERCHHMFEVRDDNGQIAFWQRATAGEPVDWDEGFAGYRAQVDWPGARFWRDLVSHYPDARVILSTRDAESWYRSFSKTIMPFIANRATLEEPRYRAIGEMCEVLLNQGIFDGRMTDPAHAMAVYDRHVEEVRDTVPAERLLLFDARKGWEPLCRFLDVPVPDVPYPHTNKSAEFEKRVDDASAKA